MTGFATNRLVLIVEDDPGLRGVFESALRTAGYETCLATDGEEALAKFLHHVPDLVILDLLMPKMNGWEVLEKLREVTDCPVIIVTGQGTTEDVVKGLLQAGADDYLVKPFGLDILTARVSAMFKRAASFG